MMQLLWIGLGLVLGFAVISLDTDIYGGPELRSSMGRVMLLLMVTIVIAPDIKGSRSWLVLGPVRLHAGGVREGRYRPHAGMAMQSV